MPNTDIDLRTIAKEQVAIRRNLEDINLSLKQTFLALDDISLSLRQTLFVLKNMSEDLHQPTEEEMTSEAIEKFLVDEGYIPKQLVEEKEDPK